MMIIDINNYVKKPMKRFPMAVCSTTHVEPPLLFQPYLADLTYPIVRHELIEHARRQQAPTAVIELLKKLENYVFNSPKDVAKELERLK